MKQYLIAIAMLLTLATTTQAAAQKHRHSTNLTAVAPVATADTTGIEAFSDTTGAEVPDTMNTYSTNGHYSVNVTTPMDNLLSSIDGGDLAGMMFILCIVAIMFLLAPVLIIVVIFYFLNKSRKDKLKLAQMAIQNGQPIPEPLIREQPTIGVNPYRGGITQICLGIGLMVFLGMIIGKLGFGIGALVFFIGLGKLIIALIDNQSRCKDYTFTPRQQMPPKTEQTPPPYQNNTVSTITEKEEE